MPVKKKTSPVQREITLEEALRVIKSQGLKLTTDSAEEVERKKEEAPSLLGMKSQIRKKRERSSSLKETKLSFEKELLLHTSHCVSGNSYGPGKVTLTDVDIAAQLESADEKYYHMALKKTTLREPECFLITGVACPDGSVKNTSVSVGSDFFDSGLSDNALASIPRNINGLPMKVAF